jgi:hypothetical protein
MPTWSTASVPPHQCFDHWREVRTRNLFGVSAELDREKHAAFAASSPCRQRAAPHRWKTNRRDAVRAGRLEMVRQFIDATLHRASLTPAQAARALGISVRQLHLLFEPSHQLQPPCPGAPAERARYLLARDPGHSVFDITLACGVESSTVFYAPSADLRHEPFGLPPHVALKTYAQL